MRQILKIEKPFLFENGESISALNIAYHTYGQLNEAKDNIIWICHALTASSDAADWWSGLVGPGKVVDTDTYFVVCANILGSCYGSSGSSQINPDSGTLYGVRFPFFTIRDMVKVHILLRQHLGIEQIHLLMGGSMGGYQAMEWAIMERTVIQNLFLIATAAEESVWGKAIHTTQRMAITADPDWMSGIRGQGDRGLKAARGIGMLTYRNYELFKTQQQNEGVNEIKNHKISSYIHYQADKLANRFDALTYYKLSEAMDTHNLARDRAANLEDVLQTILQPSLVMGISSDILCPVAEQQLLSRYLPKAIYHEIDSKYGHDGFLIENDKIGAILRTWMQEMNV